MAITESRPSAKHDTLIQKQANVSIALSSPTHARKKISKNAQRKVEKEVHKSRTSVRHKRRSHKKSRNRRRRAVVVLEAAPQNSKPILHEMMLKGTAAPGIDLVAAAAAAAQSAESTALEAQQKWQTKSMAEIGVGDESVQNVSASVSMAINAVDTQKKTWSMRRKHSEAGATKDDLEKVAAQIRRDISERLGRANRKHSTTRGASSEFILPQTQVSQLFLHFFGVRNAH